MKDGCSFRIFNYNRELIPNSWHSYSVNTFSPKIELSFRNKGLFGKVILKKYSRLTRYVGC